MNQVSMSNDDSQLPRAGDQHEVTDHSDPGYAKSAGLHRLTNQETAPENCADLRHTIASLGSVPSVSQDILFV